MPPAVAKAEYNEGCYYELYERFLFAEQLDRC